MNKCCFGGSAIATCSNVVRVLAGAFVFLSAVCLPGSSGAAEPVGGEGYVNSAGMKMVRVEPGSFMMGQVRDRQGRNMTVTYGDRHWLGGEVDEEPVHEVTISRAFHMSATEVTNAQYELFDPTHRKYRGVKEGLSSEDDEAVVYLSWHDAAAFCNWLSEREAKHYRLPTEAEWEYACRAGTTTVFNTGDTLPDIFQKEQRHKDEPVKVSTRVGVTPPNPWGLYDMHGNVEEWCYDWYGPYAPGPQTDPVGLASGTWKVVRGGSHNVYVKSLRSANRMSTLAEDKHWLIGFRVVEGALPRTEALPPSGPALNSRNVRQDRYDWSQGADASKPYFEGPVKYVIKPKDPVSVPFFFHNHVPSITWCDNGDLLAAWFSCARERGRELGIVASRFRRDEGRWDEASAFFNARDRNMHGTGLFNDGKGRILHLNGLGTDGWWSKLAMTLRVSTDNGATWSYPRLVDPEHGDYIGHMGISRTKAGDIIFPADAPGGTGLYVSRDDGLSWQMVTTNEKRKNILGTHAAAVQLADGSLYGLGRGEQIDGRMPVSLSMDMGRTWSYYASEFAPVSGGQRCVLLRLNEGPIFFGGFTDTANYQRVVVDRARQRVLSKKGMIVKDAAGKERRVFGLYGAVSFDEGNTWPVKKLITAGGPGRKLNGEAWTQNFIMDDTHAEPLGYFAVTQSPDNVIHLASSGLHYRFNLEWLKTPMPVQDGGSRVFVMGGGYPAESEFANQAGVVGVEFIYETAPFAQCHASTIVETENGLVSAWFGGAHEQNPDVGIWLSRNTVDGWTVPVEVADGGESAEKRYASWNPVLFQGREGPLMLFYKVGPSPSRWWGMMKTSQDCGRTWSPARPLPDGFLGPIKNKPFELPGGRILCPSSTEHAGWRVHFELYDPKCDKWEKVGPINDGGEFGAIQPSIFMYSRRERLQALCRSKQGVITTSWSDDWGRTWSVMTATSLPNPNSGIDAVTLADGRQLLVYNHTDSNGEGPREREMLNVAVSEDGRKWQAALVLENTPECEFSYPAVIQTADGLVHVTYTWKRERVKHVVIEPAELEVEDMVGDKWPI